MDNDSRMIDARYNTGANSATNNAEFGDNQQMIDKIDSVNNNNVMHGYPNENLRHNVSNSLNTPLSKDNKEALNNPARHSAQSPNGHDGNNIARMSNNRNKQNSAMANKQAQANGLKDRIAKAALKSSGVPSGAADQILEASKNNNNLLGNKKGIFGKLFDSLSGEKKQKLADKKSESEQVVGATLKVVKLAVFAIILPFLSFFLIMFVTLFTVYTVLDNLGISPDQVFDTSMKTIEDKLNGVDDMENAADDSTASFTKEVSFNFINIDNSIATIKLNNINLLTEAKNSIDKNDFDFDINVINDLYPSASDYGNEQYSYAFYYKMYRLNEYYKSANVCGKQVLDLPLLMITLKQQSDSMADVFASNVGATSSGEKIDKAYIDTYFTQYFAYDYNWSNYSYSKNNSIHDMEILAQHMVKVYGAGYCQYDEAGYKEFLKEFIEKKYYLGNDGGDRLYSNSKSSNYFPKYNLTEDQLLQIASLCAQEQGHSRPLGAAAEASLMANKFEVQGSKYASKYSNKADALYHYIREIGWWHAAGTYMDKRNAKPEIVEAVRDVLVNGNRTLPKYVNSHDCPNCGTNKCPSGKKGDICEVITNGVTYTSATDVADRSKYIAHQTKVINVYGTKGATFYSFPSTAGDPFSYKDTKLRAKYGECHYDPEKKTFVDCVDFKKVAIDWAVTTANDDSHGYSQTKRNSLIDFDCSSFVYYSLINSGFTTGQLGSMPFTTRTEQEILKKNEEDGISIELYDKNKH